MSITVATEDGGDLKALSYPSKELVRVNGETEAEIKRHETEVETSTIPSGGA